MSAQTAPPSVAPVTPAPTGIPAANGSMFSPGQFKSLGKLSVKSGGKVVFNTGDGKTAPTISEAVKGEGQWGLSKSGKVQVAVFCFDDIDLGTGATVEVTGDCGLVLLSKAGIAIDTTLSVNGAEGRKKDTGIGEGGPGGEGGEYGKTLSSAPPPADGGNGGPAMKDTGQPGRGFGAGFNERVKGGAPGGGGAYGGAGGDSGVGSGGNNNPPRPLPGGKVYGDPALAELFGGSGGAGASHDRATQTAGGGGGGGAIALIALNQITIGEKGRILAEGGAGGVWNVAGGGGSGGALLLAAPAIKTSAGSIVSAKGGAGGTGGPNIAAEMANGRGRRHSGSGGGGGGGRIALYTKAELGAPGKDQLEKVGPLNFNLNVDGGNSGYKAKDGVTGTIYDGTFPDLK